MRTGELIGWAHGRTDSVDVVERLFCIYVERTLFYGLNITYLPATERRRLDVLQRRAGRMLLSFCRRCPAAAVCLELNWTL